MVGTAVSARPVCLCVSSGSLNKLVEQAKSTAEMGIVVPYGVVNLETCSVVCYANAGFASAEGEKS